MPKQRRRARGLPVGLVSVIDCSAASSPTPSGSWPLLPSCCPLLFSPSSEIIIYFVFGGVLEMSGVRCCLAWHSLATRPQVSNNNALLLQYFNISNIYAHPYVLWISIIVVVRCDGFALPPLEVGSLPPLIDVVFIIIITFEEYAKFHLEFLSLLPFCF